MVDAASLEKLTRNEADMSFKRRVQTVFEWLPPNDEALYLDAPCGRGFYLKYYRTLSRTRLIGLELETAVIRKAQRNVGHLPAIALAQGNIYHLPFPDATFDGVIVSEFLEHVEDDAQALREIYRVMKPGAVVAITVPNANYPFWWDPINKTLETLFKTKIRRGVLAGIWANHVRLYDLPRLRQVVEGAGFQIEAERAMTHHSMPFLHNIAYGIGMPLLESGLLPGSMAKAADRTTFAENSGSLLNPINLGVKIFNWFDRKNVLDEPLDRSTVNLAMKGRKPA